MPFALLLGGSALCAYHADRSGVIASPQSSRIAIWCILLPAAFFVLVVPAAPSQAETLALVDQSVAFLGITVKADDGFSTETSTALFLPFVGTSQATAQGILNPELLVSSFTLDIPETQLNLSFGSSQIPAVLTVAAHYEWEPNQTIPLGSSTSFATGQLVDFWLSGTLEAFSDSAPFSFTLADYSGSTALKVATQVQDLRAFAIGAPLSFGLDSPSTSFPTILIEEFLSGTIGSLGGIDFSVDRAVVRFESVGYAVPEPSTASLAGLGLLALGAIGRRQRRMSATCPGRLTTSPASRPRTRAATGPDHQRWHPR